MKGDNIMIAGGWKTKNQIMQDYEYSKSVFYDRMDELSNSPFSDAVMADKSKYGLIQEDRYLAFLKWRSKKKQSDVEVGERTARRKRR